MPLEESKTFTRRSFTIRPRNIGSAAAGSKYSLQRVVKGGGTLPHLQLNATLHTTSKVDDQEFGIVAPLLLPYMATALRVAGACVKNGVRQQFVETSMSSHNNPLTLKIKGGLPPLYDTGRLSTAIMNSGGVNVIAGANTAKCIVTWNMPESKTSGIRGWLRKERDFEYIRALENGAKMSIRASYMWEKNLKSGQLMQYSLKLVDWYSAPRAFFVKGCREGMRIGAQAGARIMKPLADMLASDIPSIGNMPRFSPDVSAPATVLGMGMYFAPPTSLYKYFGIYGDLRSAWSGSFGDEAIFGFMRQYGWGQIGATKKSARRKFRRSIYY
jgi:hypothetical protein